MRLNLVKAARFEFQPVWWKHLNDYIASNITDSSFDLHYAMLTEELSKIGAILICADNDFKIPVAIEFSSDEDASWFILRWS